MSTRRPAHLTINGTPSLSGSKTLDEAVDILATIQRDLKELNAWNRMIECLCLNYDSEEFFSEVPPADDSLIGVWLNGCNKETGMWLLRNRVPCFIVHEVDGEEEWNMLRLHLSRCVTMLARTPMGPYETRARAYERQFLENGQVFNALQDDIGLAPYPQIPCSMKSDRIRSMSYSQGWRDGAYEDPQAGLDSAIARPGLTEVDGKIIPPPVHAVLPSKSGKIVWTVWVEDTLDSGV